MRLRPPPRPLRLLLALLLTAGWAAPGEARPAADPAAKRAAYSALQPRLQEGGMLRLIVRLNVGFTPEGRLSSLSARLQRQGIGRALAALSARPAPLRHPILRPLAHLPPAV